MLGNIFLFIFTLSFLFFFFFWLFFNFCFYFFFFLFQFWCIFFYRCFFYFRWLFCFCRSCCIRCSILRLSGLFNRARALFGLRPLLVMQQSKYFRTVYVFSTIWKEAGWGTVVYMAAIAGIDQSLYEAASIDGATRFQKMRFITFPMLLPTVITMLLLQIGSFMELGFEHVFSLLTPMTYSTGDIFDTYVYRVGILQAQYSITTAVGLFQSVIGLVMVVFFNQLSKKISDDGGLW